MRKLMFILFCIGIAFSTLGAQSSSAKFSFIRNGHGIKFDRMDVNKRHDLNYAVVCFDAVPEVSIHELTPVFSAGGASLVKREILDEGTWGFVFLIDKPEPFLVFDVCTTDALLMIGQQKKWNLKFRRPIAFWMPKDSSRNRSKK